MLDVTIVHMDNVVAEVEHTGVVCHDNHGSIGLDRNTPEEFHHRASRLSVQGGGRFVADE